MPAGRGDREDASVDPHQINDRSVRVLAVSGRDTGCRAESCDPRQGQHVRRLMQVEVDECVQRHRSHGAEGGKGKVSCRPIISGPSGTKHLAKDTPGSAECDEKSWNPQFNEGLHVIAVAVVDTVKRLMSLVCQVGRPAATQSTTGERIDLNELQVFLPDWHTSGIELAGNRKVHVPGNERSGCSAQDSDRKKKHDGDSRET